MDQHFSVHINEHERHKIVSLHEDGVSVTDIALRVGVTVKREQHNKRQQADAGDPEAPVLDELVPDKLARAEEPLEQAVKFLGPLQTLAADKIETHLMAFEIFYRKERPLLMLQSIKRAWSLNSDHPELLINIVKFKKCLEEKMNVLNPCVKAVIDKEAQSILRGRSSAQIALEYSKDASSKGQRAALAAAQALCETNASQQKFIQCAISMEHEDLTFEDCVEVLKAIRDGKLNEGVNEEAYMEQCRKRFPYALAFRPPGEIEEVTEAVQDLNIVSD